MRLRVPVRPRRLLPTEVMTNARRARTTLSERPMATARVKAMPPVGNGKTARPVTNAAHMATVKTRAAIRAKVIPAAMITARVMSATIAVTTAAPPSAAPLAATMSAHRSASRPHGATTVAPTAATSVAMTAAPDPDRIALEAALAGRGEYELFACDPALADTAALIDTAPKARVVLIVMRGTERSEPIYRPARQGRFIRPDRLRSCAGKARHAHQRGQRRSNPVHLDNNQ